MEEWGGGVEVTVWQVGEWSGGAEVRVFGLVQWSRREGFVKTRQDPRGHCRSRGSLVPRRSPPSPEDVRTVSHRQGCGSGTCAGALCPSDSGASRDPQRWSRSPRRQDDSTGVLGVTLPVVGKSRKAACPRVSRTLRGHKRVNLRPPPGTSASRGVIVHRGTPPRGYPCRASS